MLRLANINSIQKIYENVLEKKEFIKRYIENY